MAFVLYGYYSLRSDQNLKKPRWMEEKLDLWWWLPKVIDKKRINRLGISMGIWLTSNKDLQQFLIFCKVDAFNGTKRTTNYILISGDSLLLPQNINGRDYLFVCYAIDHQMIRQISLI